jgi:hypothetical protein
VRTELIFDGPGSGPLLLDHVWFHHNGTGIDGVGGGLGAKDVTITRSKFTNHTFAAITAQLTSATIDRTTFADNAVGYWGDTGSGATITGTRFVRNARAAIVTEGSATFEHSTFIDNARAVFSAGAISGLTITNSRLVGSDVAVDGTGAVSTISGSTFVANTTAVLVGQFGGTVSSSTFRANHTTISVADDLAGDVVVQGNTFRLNADGLLLDPADPLVSIGGNTARNNTGWGIYAPGATDLGGNTARRNGNSPQCVGVVCS